MIFESYYMGNSVIYAGLQTAFFFLPFLCFIPAILMGILVVWANFAPNEKTKSIVILGSIASGKTTLWNRLRGLGYKEEHVQTSEAIIDSFKIQGKEHEVTIKSTKDFGGGNRWVKYYDELINEDTFVYYLIDLTRLDEKTCKETRSRLQKIFKIISENNFNNCGLKILATHFDEYIRQNKYSKDKVIDIVKEFIGFDNLKGTEKINFSKAVLAVNLLDNNDISIIKEDICTLKKQ